MTNDPKPSRNLLPLGLLAGFAVLVCFTLVAYRPARPVATTIPGSSSGSPATGARMGGEEVAREAGRGRTAGSIASDDVGAEYEGIFPGALFIPQTLLENIVADGFILYEVSFAPGHGVEDLQDGESISFSLSYQTFEDEPITVAEPPALALFATGLAGLGFMIRRRRWSTYDV